MRKYLLVAAVMLFFAGITVASAQQFTGHVTDSTGAVIPQAVITVHNIATGIDVKTVTTSTGDFSVPYLKPGRFDVSAEASGFKKEIRSQIPLQTDQTAAINFVLVPGAVSESITVQSNAVLIDTTKADRGEVIERERVTELPLNGRNPLLLALLSPGVKYVGNPSGTSLRPFDDPQQNISINGSQPGQTEENIDGVGNATSTAASRLAYTPPVDSVQEFKIVTNPYDAQYGRSGGGAIDISLKSGTNQIHGDAYEFARRTWLDANTWQNDYFNSLNDTHVKAGHKLDQWGFELDGPVSIPKVYNGRDKSFFVLQFENWNEVVPNTIVTSVPSPQWLTGDFSNLTYWNGSTYAPVTIYDPLSGHTDPASGQFVRTPFQGNKIPANRINPVAAKILSYYPAPNTSTAGGTNFYSNNFTNPSPIVDLYKNVLGKFDHDFSPKDRFTLRYTWFERYETYPTNGIPGPAFQGLVPYGNRNQAYGTEYVHTFSPNLLFDFKANLAIVDDYYNYGYPFDESQLGWSASQIAQFAPVSHYFPITNLSGYATLGGYGPGKDVAHDFYILPTGTWIKGQHSLRFGVDVRLSQQAQAVVGGNPTLSTGNGWTQANYSSGDPASGNAIASFLLGTADSGSIGIQDTSFLSQHYFAPFVQDDWKISPKLTLNLGVRWDITPGPFERHNRGVYSFDGSITNPVSSSVNQQALGGPVLGGISYLGVGGNPRNLYATNWKHIQPRFGFAYSLDSKTVLRGGFGESFRDANPSNPSPNMLGYSANTPYIGTYDGGKTPLVNLSYPFPKVIQPTGNSLGALTGLGQGISFISPDYQLYSFWNFSTGIQRQLTSRATMEISYVGSKTYNLDSTSNLNLAPPSYTDQCDLQFGTSHIPDKCNNDYRTNPFEGVTAFQGTGYYSASTLSGYTLETPYPAFGNITETVNGGRSWYNALQVVAQYRQNNSLTLHGTYTWSKQMNAGGYADQPHHILARTIDANDRTNMATISAVYDLPVGRGRAFLSQSNRVIDNVLGGWELGNILIFETGIPWIAPQDYAGNARVPRSIDPVTHYIRGVRPCGQYWQETNGAWSLTPIPASASATCPSYNFTFAPQYSIGQNIIYSGIRLPGDAEWNANLMKNFSLYERVKLQLRFEMFNVANHPLFQQQYSTGSGDPNFGTIERGPTPASNLPRQTQIALKILW